MSIVSRPGISGLYFLAMTLAATLLGGCKKDEAGTTNRQLTLSYEVNQMRTTGATSGVSLKSIQDPSFSGALLEYATDTISRPRNSIRRVYAGRSGQQLYVYARMPIIGGQLPPRSSWLSSVLMVDGVAIREVSLLHPSPGLRYTDAAGQVYLVDEQLITLP